MRDPQLHCSGCDARFELTSLIQRCPLCAEPLEVIGDVRGARPQPGERPLLERFREFLPFSDVDELLSLGEGHTPLLRSRHLQTILNIDSLWLKVEGQNPTGSFKDRGTIAGVNWAKERGLRAIGAVSTGNMAGSVAAYAARAGLQCTVVTSPDIPSIKLGPIGVHNPRLLRLEDGYGAAYDTSIRLGGQTGTYFINSDDPMRVEGQKTLALELLEQCGDDEPDIVVLPVSSGGNAAALLKGFSEWQMSGLSTSRPLLLCVQSTGCAPIAQAYAQHELTPVKIGHPHTIAHSIANPTPPSGARLLRLLLQNQWGWAIGVTDREIEAAQLLLAEEEGLFVQPDAAASVAGLTRALRSGLIPRPRKAVLVLTGHGLKDPSVFERITVDVESTASAMLEAALRAPARA